MNDGVEADNALTLGIVADLDAQRICVIVGTCLVVKALLADFLG